MHLNHTIVHARDKEVSAKFLNTLLGLPPPRHAGPFAMVEIDADLSLDFIDGEGTIQPQHYAFLVTEAEFDAIFARMRERGLTYWADPYRRTRGEINTWDDGRGVYFDDPDGHLLELIKRPYGSGGSTTHSPHPLFQSSGDGPGEK
jgi:catechol 2,3-dioxygenase-like lactoylglutathione lyase family enzyme